MNRSSPSTRSAGLPALRPAGAARAALRRRARLRDAAVFANFVGDDRRRRRRPGARALERADRRRQRGRPLRDGAAARVRGRRPDRLGHAAGIAARRLAGGAAPSATRPGRSRSCAAGAGCRSGRRSPSSPPAGPSTRRTCSSRRGVIVLTTERAGPDLRANLGPQSEVVPVNDGDWVDLAAALAALRERGHELVLVEAGPTVFSSLLAARLVDELFLTVSPLVAGRGGRRRLSLAEDVELLPEHEVRGGRSPCGGTTSTCSCATRSYTASDSRCSASPRAPAPPSRGAPRGGGPCRCRTRCRRR